MNHDRLAAAVCRLLASRWVKSTVSCLSSFGMSSQAGRSELEEQESIFAELRDALEAKHLPWKSAAKKYRREALENYRLFQQYRQMYRNETGELPIKPCA